MKNGEKDFCAGQTTAVEPNNRVDSLNHRG